MSSLLFHRDELCKELGVALVQEAKYPRKHESSVSQQVRMPARYTLMSAGSYLSLGNTCPVCKHDLLRFKTCALLSKKALHEKTGKRGLRVCVCALDDGVWCKPQCRYLKARRPSTSCYWKIIP